MLLLGIGAWVAAAACGGQADSNGLFDSTGGNAAGSSAASSGGSASGASSAGSSSLAGSSTQGGDSSSTAGDGTAGAPDSGGSTAAGGGGSSALGGAGGELCGGKTCAAEQVCCGPAECGFCVSKLSGIACPASCQSEGGAGGLPDCESLLSAVQQAQAEAQACNPASAKPTPDCVGTLEGLCCPIVVEQSEPSAPANAAYLRALKAYKASCAHPCPRIACIDPSPGKCQAASAMRGSCVP